MSGKKVLVVGLGKSGVAAVRHSIALGARVTATDLKAADALDPVLKGLEGVPVALELGRHDEATFAAADVVIVSPGVPADLPGIAEARLRGAAVVGEMELAVQSIDRPIVAITGTNGKTTTTTLVGHLLREAGLGVCVAGNIGTPLLDALEEAKIADVVVLEVSSFQVETTPSIAPKVAVWLNATPDHLDRHATFENYVDCKARLFRQVPADGWGIYNAADDVVSQAVVTSRCSLIPFDATGRFLKKAGGARGWFAGGELCVDLGSGSMHRYQLAGVHLEGLHNRENMLAALIACELMGADSDALQRGLESFKGLPHRVELVGEHRGVRYYDDSKGTNIGATMRALEGFAEPVVLIAGGLSKGVDFAPLGPIVKGHVKKLVLIGEAAGELEATLGKIVSTVRASSMDEAVGLAHRFAEPGDVVLLSPACASFDMFKDYADRGRAFVRAMKSVMERDG